MPLGRDAQFHSIALPPVRPEREAPWSGQCPHEGSLYLPDAQAVAGLVGEWTTTPGRCWFCVWDGYDWGGTLLTPLSEPSVRLPDPVPAPSRPGFSPSCKPVQYADRRTCRRLRPVGPVTEIRGKGRTIPAGQGGSLTCWRPFTKRSERWLCRSL